jgi:hypothetical protein
MCSGPSGSVQTIATRDGVLVRDRRGAQPNGADQVVRAGEDLLADADVGRQRLAGEHRLVDGCLAADHDTVHRDALARLHGDDLVNVDLLDWDKHGVVVDGHHPRLLGHQFEMSLLQPCARLDLQGSRPSKTTERLAVGIRLPATCTLGT